MVNKPLTLGSRTIVKKTVGIKTNQENAVTVTREWFLFKESLSTRWTLIY